MAAFVTSVLLLALQIALGQAKKCNTGFSVVAPEVAVPGKTTAILVTLHGRDKDDTEPLNVTIQLEAQEVDNEANLLTAVSQMMTSYGIIPLKIPPSPSGHCTLHTTVGCNGTEECTSRSHSAIRLLGPVRDIIVRPARHHYRPGEMLTFWILALDHDLRLVQGELAKVAVSDPAGTKVAIWEELSLDEGVRKLSLMLPAGATTGSWHVEAHCGGASATVEITVSAATGNSVPASAAAEQHYVELRFADNMRRRYKPGLPFVGRVKAMSTEQRVRVRVKLYDDKTDIYSQDIDMSTGEGSFIVPTVIAEAPYINLQAELVAVEGKEIETHYVLAKEKIHRWNSTSKCYLLIENLPTPMQVGNVASATVWSSCGCHEQLLAAVTSEGRAVHWAAVPAINVTDKMCSYNHTFPITADMAPVSSLLVYYVMGTGEPVSDVASFHVKLLHKEVAIAVEERRWWYPRAALQLRVVAPSDSKMCLIGARTPTDSKFDGHHSTSEHEDQPGPEFVSAGVSLFVGGGDCGGGGGVLYRQRTTPAPKSPAHLVPPSHHDRLWMWKCFNYTSQLSTDGVTIAAPSEAGRWSIWALSLSSRGLRFSSPKTINVFRPIQLDFSLPSSLRVGETVELDVKITNNINNCMDVTALLAVSSGANFASTGALFVTERLRLGPRGGTQLVVRIAVNTPGRKNVTVEITGYGADNCSVSYTSFSNESLVGSVIRSANVLVVPEGLQRTDTQSAYFCANEHLAVSSRGSWEWKWVPAPRNRAGLVLEFRAQGSAHIALSSAKEPSDDMYRVVFEKSKVWIARGKHGYDVHLASAEQTDTDDDCTQDSWCSCWVWWGGGRLSVGRGAVPAERRLLVWPLAQDVKIKFVGFSALWGDKADFRIWNFNEEAGFSQVLELGLPHGVVPGSASGNLLISGGLHLPLYTFQSESNNQWESVWKDSQLSAAAARLAPLLALEHIPHLVGENERENILKRLPEQVQILLSFRKSDNSFSEHPAVSSHTSTVQILEILSKIQSYYPIDPELLQSTKKWIQDRQNPDGSYTPLSVDKEVDYYVSDVKKVNVSERDVTIDEYYYYDEDGSMSKEEMEKEKRVEVTAETLATLLEVGVENQKDADVAKKAQTYLEKNFHKLTSPASLAATVLALILSRSPLVPEALAILRNASTTEEGEFGWPPPKKDAADWLFDDNSKTIKTTSYEAVTLEQYIAAVRVLLAACARGALSEGEAAARFLYYRASTLQRHPNIAYSATKAAAQFAALAHDRHRDLTISLATAGMELTDTLELQAKTPPKALQLPGLPTKVFVYATGAGCATVQGSSSYSTYIPKPENTLLALDSCIIEEIRPERSSIEDLQGNLPTLNIKTCFKWKGKEKSGILRLEVSLFSGYELHSVSPVVLDGPVHADLHYGSRGESVWFVFANITSVCPVCVTYQVKSRFIVTSLRPAFAKIYPSTRPDLAVETFFHGSSGSPLLKGITDDDFITWFDKTVVLSLLNSTNVNDICECGRVCKKNIALKNKAKVSKINVVKQVKKQKEISVVSNEIAAKITEPNTLQSTGKSHTVNETTSTLPTFLSTNKVETLITEEPKNQTTNSQYNDDPIIIPTATYVNSTSISNNSDDNKIPIISEGALIIQKEPAPKTNATNLKPLPRRKGTLKSTYGDKHETIIKELLNSTTTPKLTIVKNISQKAIPTKSVNGIKTVINNSSKYIAKTIEVLEKTTPAPFVTSTTAGPVYEPNQQNKTPMDSIESKLTKTQPQEIISITNSNLNTIVFHRTKKPKSRILKPVYNPTVNNTKLSQQINTNQAKPTQYNTKTEIKSKPDTNDKPGKKSKKSINKEIGELPSKPISETTKILEETQKPDTLPENREGFEILDQKPNGVSKEHALDILKDKPNTAKIDDQLYKFNLQQQNVSSLNSTRSL